MRRTLARHTFYGIKAASAAYRLPSKFSATPFSLSGARRLSTAMDNPQHTSQSATQGTVHSIGDKIFAFQPARHIASTPSTSPQNTILWIGGQFDTLLSVSYTLKIARALPPEWTIFLASLSSTGFGWGVSTLSRDAAEMAQIVTYLRTKVRLPGKIVLMGHSTGCQDVMEYIVGPPPSGTASSPRPPVDGLILQASASDREMLVHMLPEAKVSEMNALATQLVRDGRERDALPYALTKGVFGRLALTARRWLDLSSPGPEHAGADDYFSTDLPVERLRTTFGRLPPSSPLLVLFSGEEEFVPPGTDKEALVERWLRVTEQSGGVVDREGSGLVPGASHNLNGQGDEIVGELVRRVVNFVAKVGNDKLGRPASNI